MLFTKVKHITSSWVKGALWPKSGPGSDWAELGFDFCTPATITDPLDQLPLVNSRSFFIQSPSGAAYRTELLQKICRTQHVFPQFIAFCSCFCLPNKSEISLHFSQGQWRVRAPYDITKVSVLELCFNTNFLKSGTCKKKEEKSFLFFFWESQLPERDTGWYWLCTTPEASSGRNKVLKIHLEMFWLHRTLNL